jgi:hypothetical protein
MRSSLGLRPESRVVHRPISVPGVLRLRATETWSSDQSARRFAQDDRFAGGCTTTQDGPQVHQPIPTSTTPGGKQDKRQTIQPFPLYWWIAYDASGWKRWGRAATNLCRSTYPGNTERRPCCGRTYQGLSCLSAAHRLRTASLSSFFSTAENLRQVSFAHRH